MNTRLAVIGAGPGGYVAAFHAADLGMQVTLIDVDKLRAWKDQVVKKQAGGLGLLAKSRKVTYIQGRASFVNAKTLSVETATGEQKVEADYVIVATGSRPTTVPNVSIERP